MSNFNNYRNNNYNNNRNNFRNNNKNGNRNNSQKSFVSVDESVSYVNPYNFISLNEDGCKRSDCSLVDYENSFTGYLECNMTTKTETMVPDTNDLDDSETPYFNFFNYQEKRNNFVVPVIPGSEIRGMLRSDFETFTDSCMSTVDKDKRFISRFSEPRLPGINRKDGNGKWHLYEAVRYALHTTIPHKGYSKEFDGKNGAIYEVDSHNNLIVNGQKYKTGDTICFDGKSKGIINNVLEINEKGSLRGLLFIGELGGKKELIKGKNSIHDSIFVIGNEVYGLSELDQAVQGLKETYEMYNDKAFNKNLDDHKTVWYEGYDFNNEELPIWYSKPDKGRTYLSLAAIGKNAFHRTLNDLLDVCGDKAKSYTPCIDKKSLCEACDMFGFANEDAAKGSKIRVSDAIYEGEENPYGKTRLLKELSSPHISNATFYSLFKTNAELASMEDMDWNYDFMFTRDGQVPIGNSQIGIRGRKMYWHHKPTSDTCTDEENKRNCGITPVKENITFKFKVYFDNISKKELQDLIAVINLNYDSDVEWNNKKYYDLCHKIGKAKPFGYGSVKIEVVDAKVRNVSVKDNKVSYNLDNVEEALGLELKDIKLNNTFDTNSNSFKDILRMYNFNYIEANYSDSKVLYPLAQNKGMDAGHFWFIDNKSKKLRYPYVLIALPLVSEGRELTKEGLKATNTRNGITVKIDGLKLPKYKG